MTEEDFLQRWSRRKRQSADVGKPAAEPAPPKAEVPQQTGPIAAPAEPFDPATLPPIDSITALSDISAFLQKGVPPELTRAALRHVWTADPAIRNFVGLAENAWDFTDPNAMPGFGPLELNDEVRRMIAGIVDKIGTAAQPSVPEAATDHAQVSENPSVSSPVEPSGRDGGAPLAAESAVGAGVEVVAQNLDSQVLVHSNKDNPATQHDVAESNKNFTQMSRRPHGRALPR
jgi:hypothetical protein